MVGTDGLSQTCNSVGAGLATPENGGDFYCSAGSSISPARMRRSLRTLQLGGERKQEVLFEDGIPA